MVLVEQTSTPDEALPLAELKAHLKLGSGFADDAVQDEVLESYLRAAMAAIEARIGKMLFARGFTWELTRWVDRARQPLPVAPVSVVTEIAILDGAGAQEIVDESRYNLERDAHRPVVLGALPAIGEGQRALVSFEAGFGPAWSDLPLDLRQAVLLLSAHYYENRRETSGAGGLMPFGVMGLLEPHRNIRVFGGRA